MSENAKAFYGKTRLYSACRFICCYGFIARQRLFCLPKPYAPRPENCLAFYPRDRERVVYADSGKTVDQLPVVFFGQHTVMTNRYIGHDFLVLQIHFQPGAVFRLKGIPLSEFNNVYTDAGHVFSNDIHQVNEQFYELSFADRSRRGS